MIKEIEKIDEKARLCGSIGIEKNVWKFLDPSPPKELIEFSEKKLKDQIIFPKTEGDIFIMTKCIRIDLCYELKKLFLKELGKNLKSYKQTLGWSYLPIPMASRDLTGFLDGTRNPDHLLRAIVGLFSF
jgi:porphyrinogen peroxidase